MFHDMLYSNNSVQTLLVLCSGTSGFVCLYCLKFLEGQKEEVLNFFGVICLNGRRQSNDRALRVHFQVQDVRKLGKADYRRLVSACVGGFVCGPEEEREDRTASSRTICCNDRGPV